ncbi:Heat-inducible transcription repressor HrcA [Pseudoclavibacter triregionum]|nr:Heat-inducible transcription repressor HrcA [Pseudoclavibacter triregionum]
MARSAREHEPAQRAEAERGLDVTPRGLEVLRVIVSDYIVHREPVGSKSIADRHAFGVSAATIRNDMAQLEEAELITAPHTSSGRIPTDKGYRLFVDRLADLRPLTAAQRRAIERFLEPSGDFDGTLERAVRTLATLTSSVAILQVPSLAVASIRHVEFVKLGERRLLTVVITDSGRVEQRVGELAEPISDELVERLREGFGARLVGRTVGEAAADLRDVSGLIEPRHADLLAPIVANLLDQALSNTQERLVMAGASNLAHTERDFSSIAPVLEAIEEQVALLRLLQELSLDDGVAVRIGGEHRDAALSETALVAAGYSSDDGEARLGVLGPTRMDYQRNLVAVRAVARYLSRLFDGPAGGAGA